MTKDKKDIDLYDYFIDIEDEVSEFDIYSPGLSAFAPSNMEHVRVEIKVWENTKYKNPILTDLIKIVTKKRNMGERAWIHIKSFTDAGDDRNLNADGSKYEHEDDTDKLRLNLQKSKLIKWIESSTEYKLSSCRLDIWKDYDFVLTMMFTIY